MLLLCNANSSSTTINMNTAHASDNVSVDIIRWTLSPDSHHMILCGPKLGPRCSLSRYILANLLAVAMTSTPSLHPPRIQGRKEQAACAKRKGVRDRDVNTNKERQEKTGEDT